MNLKEYIVTQDPLKETVEDFWQMIIQYKSRCIITTSTSFDMAQVFIFKYFHFFLFQSNIFRHLGIICQILA